jgi:hypothetical protein
MTDDLIQQYLDDLTSRLRGSPTYVRRVIAEAEEHLAEGVDARVAQGSDEAAAEAAALAEFGSAPVVARELNRATWRDARPALRRDVVETGLRLLGVGMIVVGVAGAVARVVAAVTTTDSVFGAPAALSPSAGDCAHWESLHPSATTCQAAATMEAATDQTLGMLATGLLGVLLLVALAVAGRRWPRQPVLPRALAPTVAATAFALAAAGLFALAVSDVVVLSTWGSGLWWTCAACSLAAALVSLFTAARSVREDLGVAYR